ncbi:hypothetical protein [Mycetohabitans endofungorum]|uniref:hypothetical protein n=1 Tax=Mycetohabitans endofungorum TaxID=417203 RepID=UPI002B05520B|nr:hypothetical protein [Mycetohabitans endofungorum]
MADHMDRLAQAHIDLHECRDVVFAGAFGLAQVMPHRHARQRRIEQTATAPHALMRVERKRLHLVEEQVACGVRVRAFFDPHGVLVDQFTTFKYDGIALDNKRIALFDGESNDAGHCDSIPSIRPAFYCAGR